MTGSSAAGSAPDRGAALVMAIVFVTVIGLVLAGSLGYATVSMRAASRTYAPERDRLYAADAAVRTAARYVVTHPSEARSGTGCSPLRLYGSVLGDKVEVQVCPQGATSLTMQATGGDGGLTTLATGTEVGLSLNGAGSLAVNGPVDVNSSIAVGATSSLAVTGGALEAVGGCNGRITVDGLVLDPASCEVDPPPAADPGWTAGITTPPAAASGSCNTTTKVATLQPGTWTSAALTAAIGTCTAVWLMPGVHHLDSVAWTIKAKVVGGTLNGAIATSPVPGGCVDDGAGVLLVLGGSSAITLSGAAASLQVCGRDVPQAAGTVRLAVYGPTTDLASTVADTLLATQNPTGSGWTSPANAKLVDGLVATAKVAKRSTSNTLTIGGVNGELGIPTTVNALTAAVTGQTSQAATVSLTVQSSGSGSNACTTASAVALPTAGLGTVSVALVCTRTLVAPLTVKLTVTTPNTGSTRTVRIDGLQLRYSVAGAKVAAQSGCVVTVGGCDALAATSTGSRVWFGGQVYLPRARVSVLLPAAATVLTTRRVVVRSLAVQGAGSSSIGTVAAEVASTLSPGDAVITAYVGGTPWTSCRVTFPVQGATVADAVVEGCTVPR